MLSADELSKAKQRAGVASKKTGKKKMVARKKTTKKATKKKKAKKKTTKKKATKASSGGKGWTRYRYQDGKSDKFWAIKVHGSSHTVHYGRTGTDGQQKTKDFASPAAAKAAAEKLVAQKLKKGYS